MRAAKLEGLAEKHFEASDEVDRQQSVIKIFEQHNEALQKFLLRRTDSREDAREIAQEVYLRVLRKNRDEVLQYPRAFIFTIAANLIKDRVRNKVAHASNQHVPITEGKFPCPAPSPEQVTHSRETLDIIAGVLERSKPATRKAFILNRFKGMTYDEIASEMGISKSMVKHHISTVLVDCRDALRGN